MSSAFSAPALLPAQRYHKAKNLFICDFIVEIDDIDIERNEIVFYNLIVTVTETNTLQEFLLLSWEVLDCWKPDNTDNTGLRRDVCNKAWYAPCLWSPHNGPKVILPTHLPGEITTLNQGASLCQNFLKIKKTLWCCCYRKLLIFQKSMAIILIMLVSNALVMKRRMWWY